MSDASDEAGTLGALHREMVRGRAIEAEVLRLVDDRRFNGFYHPGKGQVAGPVGVCAALRRDDVIFYAHRGLTYLTAKGMDPVAILGDFLGTRAGSTGGLGAGIVHCVDPDNGVLGQGGTLGSCFPLVAGAALGFQLQGNDRVAVAFFGDGTAARGTFLESAVFAVARKLPVVFLCENNGLAVSARVEETQGTTSLAPRAAGFGLDVQTVDGFDVEAVHGAARRAVARARAGDGPAFIEATSVRGLGHYAGDLQPYRKDRGTLATDPIDVAEKRLLNAGVTPDALRAVADSAQAEMRAAAEKAAEASRPGLERLFEGVWARSMASADA